jgi:hypothetical protein
MAWVALAAVVAASIAGAAILVRSKRRWAHHRALTALIRELVQGFGAKEIGEGIYEFEGRRYQIEVESPGVFGGPLGLTVALFTDRVHEFYVRRAGGLPTHPLPDDAFYKDYSIEGRVSPALREYLTRADVKEILKRVMPGRWKTFGKGYVIAYFSDNEFPVERLDAAELKLALKSLKHLDVDLHDPLRGGAFTFRSGFESDLPPWHWSRDAVQALPSTVTRAVVSYYHDNPYLNEGLVDFFNELAGSSRKLFLSHHEDLEFLVHAFGVTRDGPVVETDRSLAAAAADQYLDGQFFSAFVAADRPLSESIRSVGRHALHDAIVRELANLKFYVRRLLDDEASWYNGEYEILSLQLDAQEFAAALEKVALKYEAKIIPLERRFTLKVFRDEKFEYST